MRVAALRLRWRGTMQLGRWCGSRAGILHRRTPPVTAWFSTVGRQQKILPNVADEETVDRVMKDVDSHKRELEKRPVTDDDVERALGNLKALGTADMLIECMDKFVCLHDGMSSQPLLKAAIMKEWRKHVIIGFCRHLGYLFERQTQQELIKGLHRIMCVEALKLIEDEDDAITLLIPNAAKLGKLDVVDGKDCELVARTLVKDDATAGKVGLKLTWQLLADPDTMLNQTLELTSEHTLFVDNTIDLYAWATKGRDSLPR
ncbi:Uncharacterized protein PBTT_08100 [Plasmodiophora brassicae]|uniref:Uncharacterized protein n=1 Tax=Plasmodiophora brassicae TaxID=37360 RepID=A0A0G4IKF5_PLABS|nr:hypothetical protein PBRA_004291 [Plasmodiophora brassicae]SPR00437.1 unnamed protein product [Plasmodiophora brassicae]